ncbi:MAG: hypothetical protein IT328_03345 [Caldilineaceae bacterium]|nr:hypothetical protein [Caldilineaceae bacterium]
MDRVTLRASCLRFPLFGELRLSSALLWGGLMLSTVVVVAFGLMLKDFAVDDAYITFRHAQNLVSGNGFSFNPGDRLLSTTSPLHALLLALLAWLGFTNLPLVAVWLSVASMVVLSASILLSFIHVREPVAGLLCVILLIFQHWLYRFFSLETILVLALNVTAVALALRHRWAWAGLAAGIAMIGRPDSIVLSGTIGLFALLTHKASLRAFGRYAVACAVSYGIWVGFSIYYFGSPLPNTLEAKSGFETWSVFAAAIWPKMISDLIPGYWQLEAILVILAGVGCVDLMIKRSPLLIFPVWGVLHTLGYTLLQIGTAFAWYYAPLILIVILLGSIGGTAILRYALRWRRTKFHAFAWPVAATILLFFVVFSALSVQGSWTFLSTYKTAYFAGARDQAYRQVGHWLNENTPPDATVLLVEVGTIGYFSKRRIIDLAGLVTYELRNLSKQRTYREAVDVLRPDYVIASRGIPPDPELTGLDGYTVVQQFPKGENNQFEDIVIYRLMHK